MGASAGGGSGGHSAGKAKRLHFPAVGRDDRERQPRALLPAARRMAGEWASRFGAPLPLLFEAVSAQLMPPVPSRHRWIGSSSDAGRQVVPLFLPLTLRSAVPHEEQGPR